MVTVAKLPTMQPGTRWMLSSPDGAVVYRGTALADGSADVDVLSGRGVDPVRMGARDLHDIYDPEVHTFDIIGTAV